jgi:hypothetical protein
MKITIEETYSLIDSKFRRRHKAVSSTHVEATEDAYQFIRQSRETVFPVMFLLVGGCCPHTANARLVLYDLRVRWVTVRYVF